MTNETGLLRDLKPGDRVRIDGQELECTGSFVQGPNRMIDIGLSRCGAVVTYRAPRTIGTLKEIGAKVGDVVEDEGGWRVRLCQLKIDNLVNNQYRIVQDGPVRTVTKTEIVPGVYGPLRVTACSGGSVGLLVDEAMEKDRLDILIQHLQDIREAL